MSRDIKELEEKASVILNALAAVMGGYSQISLQTIADVGIGHFRNRGYDKYSAIQLSLKVHSLLCSRFNNSESDVLEEVTVINEMLKEVIK